MPVKEIALFGLLLSVASPAIAQEKNDALPTPRGPCWDVYPGNSAAPYSAILLNKCDGRSWLLTKNAVADKQGKATNSWIWRWAPLGTEPDEAVLSLPGGGQSITVPTTQGR